MNKKLLLLAILPLLFVSFPNAFAAATVDYLVVGGGGGGGADGSAGRGGGGGAGGYLNGTGHTVTVGSYTITIGAGGAGGVGNQVRGSNGGFTVFDSFNATGGGGGGSSVAQDDGANGGSGGGASPSGTDTGTAGTGTIGQGNDGGIGATGAQRPAGGGGGAGAVGAAGVNPNGGAGGAGLSTSISGTSLFYAGGGGGATATGTLGSGGSGVGGNGGSNSPVVACTSATANRGGGGGGAATAEVNGCAGGSGIVIIRYATGIITATGGTITTDGGDTIHTFTTSGVFNVTSVNGAVPDAVTDLTSPTQSFGSVDLLWSLPNLNNGTCTGHQINYTTPYGNPLTVLSDNTGSCTTSSTVSGLSIATPYTFGVSVITNFGSNATHPPMNWLNVTTQGNFTIGTAVFNQTNSQVLPITFEEQSINSTATFLNVTYANTFTLSCDFYYQFANNNRTYSNLTGYAVSTTLDETYFILTDFEDEIINIECFDTITGTDANYLMEQSSFPLLDQIANFRNGTYGTMGLFGVFDLVTIAVVIFSMIGLNRVNESVGAIFNVILLGSLAWFEIIELPTVIFGVLTVVIIFIITSTKKD